MKKESKLERIMSWRDTHLSLIERDKRKKDKLVINIYGEWVYKDRDENITYQ